ncbi:tripartite tricarboxylate transporter substrate-binding protein [Cupriavidus basilensis]|uniref:tripartite tricarboxylate transporter substrate-binding protein n=2 Tax=Cupriavidus TaxID=106589 RepID=UPI0007508128|nr:tripartite tricarboxylate transporter substrate-binding protein [Cupriavidus basilensis]
MTSRASGRRMVLKAGGAAALALLSGGAFAQTYPARPLTLIVPFAAGGPTDILGRVIAEGMARDLGQPVVVENLPGAGGTLGTARAVRAAPDGYTLVIGNVGTLAANATLYKSLSYNVLKDLIPLASVGDAPQVITARKDFPATGLDQFAAYARQNAGKMNAGAAGVGSGSFLGSVLVNARLGVNVNIANYRGAGLALNDVAAGHIDYLVDSTTTSTSFIKSGMVKGVVVLRPRRISALPDVPAAGESGIKDLNYDIWNMVLAPKGTPAPVVARLNKALRSAVRDPQTQARLAPAGVEVPAERQQTPEGAAELLAGSVATWRTLLSGLNVTLD